MIIHSKFSDYYDSTGFYDADAKHWVREQKEIIIEKQADAFEKIRVPGLQQEQQELLMRAFRTRPDMCDRYGKICNDDKSIIVGFCGKLYLVYLHYRSVRFSTTVYSATCSFEDYLSTRKKIDPKYKPNTRMRYIYGMREQGFPFTATGTTNWHWTYHKKRGYDDIFIALNTPIFILKEDYRGIILVISPCLKDYRLQGIFHPFTAHQNIDTYLGNEMAQCTLKDFQMSDELKRDSKGMDKWSFKQRGPKKRKRK